MRHRRRNPSLSDVNSFFTLALVAGGGYVFYKYVWPLLNKLPAAVDTAANAIAAPIADAYVAMTSGPAAQVLGSVVLSTGEQVTMQDISAAGGLTPVPNSNAFSFMWNNKAYVISGPHDANGNYLATLAPFGVIDSGW